MKKLIEQPQKIDPATVAMTMMQHELRKAMRIPLAALAMCGFATVLLAKCLHNI